MSKPRLIHVVAVIYFSFSALFSLSLKELRNWILYIFSCVVIILLKTDLFKSAFSAYSFLKN